MALYNFSCSSPDDWSNWHMWVKTFGPGIITACVTGSIAAAAYRVARTQREIAANKYDLDLFDKRYPLFEKVNETAEKIEKYNVKKSTLGDIKLLDENSLDDYCKKCLVDLNKISKFDTAIVKNIYDEINKSIRLYKNITPESIFRLKENIIILEENKKLTYNDGYGNIYCILCDTTNAGLYKHILDIHKFIPDKLKHDYIQNLDLQLQQQKDNLRNVKNEMPSFDKSGNKSLNQKEQSIMIRISYDEHERSSFIENENNRQEAYEEFSSYISTSFSAMEEIQACIIFIRNEMNRHLNVSEVSYQKKKVFFVVICSRILQSKIKFIRRKS